MHRLVLLPQNVFLVLRVKNVNFFYVFHKLVMVGNHFYFFQYLFCRIFIFQLEIGTERYRVKTICCVLLLQIVSLIYCQNLIIKSGAILIPPPMYGWN